MIQLGDCQKRQSGDGPMGMEPKCAGKYGSGKAEKKTHGALNQGQKSVRKRAASVCKRAWDATVAGLGRLGRCWVQEGWAGSTGWQRARASGEACEVPCEVL